MNKTNTTSNEVNNTAIIKNLEAQGFTVEIIHRRRWKVVYMAGEKIVTKPALFDPTEIRRGAMFLGLFAPSKVLAKQLLPKGGRTEMIVRNPAGEMEFIASAECHPKDDYNKKIGVQLCLQRILEEQKNSVDTE